jgi:predicted SAM-dependent methyltransferase
VMHHVLCMLDLDDVKGLLAEIHRVLKPGAHLRISAADVIAGVRAAMDGDTEWFAEPKYDEKWDGQDIDLEQTVGYFVTQGGARKWLMQPETLMLMLDDAGFNPFISQYRQTLGPAWLADLDQRERESFYIEATRH